MTLGKPKPWMLERYAGLTGQSIEPYAARSIGGTIMITPDGQPVTDSQAAGGRGV